MVDRIKILGLPGLFFALSVLAFGTKTAYTDQVDFYGGSPKAISMGGAFTAIADDYSAAYYNPAGLGQLDLSSVSLGYAYFKPNVENRGQGPSFLDYDVSAHTALVGLVANVDQFFKNLEDHRINVGIMLYFMRDLKSVEYVSTYGLGTRQAPLYDSAADALNITVGLGGEVLEDKLYAGIGFRFAAIFGVPMLELRTDLAGRYSLNKMDIDADTEIAPIGGIIYKPTKRLRLGFAYRGDINPISLGGTMAVTAEAVPGVSIPLNLKISFSDPYNPEEYSWGAAYQVSKNLLVSTDVTLARWSKFQAPFGHTYPTVFDDTVVPRVGVEYVPLRDKSLPLDLGRMDKLALRMGYFYQESPIAKKQPYTNFVDNNIHGLAWGIGTSLNMPKFFWHPFDFDVFLQYLRADAKHFETIGGGVDTEGYHIGAGFLATARF